MIFKDDLLVDQSGEDLEEIEYGIAPESMGLAIKVLSQYSDAISSIVREITSNCFDSNEEASLIPNLSDEEIRQLGYEEDPNLLRDHFTKWDKSPIDKRVRVDLIEQVSLAETIRSIKFTDFGVGLSPSRVKNIFTKFLSSTKRNTNSFIGAYGLGSKSPLGYTDVFSVVTVYFGIKYHYLISTGQRAPDLKLIKKEETDQINGTVVSISIENAADYEKFKTAIRTQLMYFDNVIITGVSSYVHNEILRMNNFVYRENSSRGLHVCLGKVYYPLDTYKFDLDGEMAYMPVGLRFDIGELDVVWNRESLEYTDRTINSIANKIERLKEELQTIYNFNSNQISNIEELFEASKQQKANSITIGDYSIPCKDWIETNLIYNKYSSLGSISPAIHAGMAIDVYKIITGGYVDKYRYRHSLYEHSSNTYLMEEGDKLNVIYNKYISTKHRAYIIKLVNIQDACRLYYASYVQKKKDKDYFYLSDEYKKEMETFVSEIFDHIKNKVNAYDPSLTPQDFIDEQKKIRSMMHTSKNNSDFSISYLLINKVNGNIYNWSRESFKVLDPNASALGRWIKLGRPIVYGTSNEKDLMEKLCHYCYINNNAYYHFYYQKDRFHPSNTLGAPLFITVSLTNVKQLKEMPTALSALEFNHKIDKSISRTKTAALINELMKDIHLSCSVQIQEFNQLRIKIQNYISKNTRSTYTSLYKNKEAFIDIDTSLFNDLLLLNSVECKYPLLKYIMSDISIDGEAKEEINFYIKSKGKVSPRLIHKLLNKKGLVSYD